MTLTIEKTNTIRIAETINLLDIGGTLFDLLAVQDNTLKSKIINEFLTCFSKIVNNLNNKTKILIATRGIIPSGLIVCQLNSDKRFATFKWIYTLDLESFRLLIQACEFYALEQGFKKVRGIINYSKHNVSVGYQALGHDPSLMNGVQIDSPEMHNFEFLKQLGYKPISIYNRILVVQKTWN